MGLVEANPSPLCLTPRLLRSLGKSSMNTLRPMTSATSADLVDHVGFKVKKARKAVLAKMLINTRTTGVVQSC